MKSLSLSIALFCVPGSLIAWDPEPVFLQQTLWDFEVSAPEVIYQRGSQILLKMERIDTSQDPIGHIGWRSQIIGTLMELPIPSFMTLLTTDSPAEGDTILYQEGEWLTEYTIDLENPEVLSYDMTGPIDVSNYPWIEVQEMGTFYVTPIAKISSQENDERFAVYHRWIYHEKLGWFSNMQQFISLPWGTYMWPVVYSLPEGIEESLP